MPSEAVWHRKGSPAELRGGWQREKRRKDPFRRLGELVEAAGQLFCFFRSRLDYAFIPVARDAERVIRRTLLGES
jgi:hypothetical protein